MNTVELQQNHKVSLDFRDNQFTRILIAGYCNEPLLDSLTNEGDQIYYLAENADVDKVLLQNRNIKLVASNATDLPFEDGWFDKIMAIRFVRGELYPRWVIQELNRTLKDNGQFILTLPNSYKFIRFINPLFFVKKLLRINDSTATRKIHFKYNQVADMLRRVDIAIERKVTIGFPFGKIPKSTQQTDYSSFQNYNLGEDFLIFGKKKDKIAIKKELFASDLEGFVKYIESSSLYQKLNTNLENWQNQYPDYKQMTPVAITHQRLKNKNILILSPHPDDELIGVGGLSLELLQHGGKVNILQLMDGRKLGSLDDAPESEQTARTTEAIKVAEAMKANEIITWNAVELNKGNVQALSEKLYDLILKHQPDWVFVPFIEDIHPDHVETNRVLYHALEKLADVQLSGLKVFSYEVWNKVPVNAFIKIDAVFEEKMRLMMLYKVAMMVQDYVDFCREMNLYNHYRLLKKPGFAEVFFELDAKSYFEIAKAKFED